jgi:RNA polymerase sigma factor (sigma-70 family)
MDQKDQLAERFEECRPYLRGVAYRMLGSLSEADDAIQEAWIRLDRAASEQIEDLRSWLTTVVARICLDILRARRARDEEVGLSRLPEPILTDEDSHDPEEQALVADSVGLALLIVLETLTPGERVAFVLHDVFGVEFAEVARILGKSEEAARQMASRARRRVRDAAPSPDKDVEAQRAAVDAFLAASRAGNFDALMAILDPSVVMRLSLTPAGGPPGAPITIEGAEDVARRVMTNGAPFAHLAKHVFVNGALGVVVGPRDDPISVVGFTVSNSLIVELDLIVDVGRAAAAAQQTR